MRRVGLNVRFVCCALATLALAGCPADVAEKVQDAQQQVAAGNAFQEQMGQLRVLGQAYHRHIDATSNGPANWQELKQSGANDPALQALEAAGCVVTWGKTFRDAPNGTSEFVVAYLPTTLESGGAVLVLDGAVLNLTADELKQKLAAQQQPAP